MSKRKKLYHLRERICIEIEQVCVLLKHSIYFGKNDIEKNVLAEVALEKANKISKMNEKIGLILRH